MICCAHSECKKHGRDRYGNQRYRCTRCGKTWADVPANPLGPMRTTKESAKLVLRLLSEGMSIRATERVTKVHRDTICRLIVRFGDACRRFLDKELRGLTLNHVEVDEQWTWVAKKQSRLTVIERAERAEIGDVYLWMALDQKTKLIATFMLGKRSADNARRFMVDLASRLVPTDTRPHASDAHAYQPGGYQYITQISTDGFPAYPEAVDLAFGPYAKFGTITKEYKNANMIYTPSEMVGTKRRGVQGIGEKQERTICTSHVERFNGTTRLFMKRLNRLTYCFSKKLKNLEAAVAMYVAYYDYCWRTRKPGNSGRKHPQLP